MIEGALTFPTLFLFASISEALSSQGNFHDRSASSPLCSGTLSLAAHVVPYQTTFPNINPVYGSVSLVAFLQYILYTKLVILHKAKIFV